jgi:UDP-N-acetylmuramoyl-tripeptide--D-alanyl-D-alanine ligase
MQIPQLYDIYVQHSSVQTDTRKLKKGDLYFALKGPNFNGNLFAIQALGQGAAYCIVDEDVQLLDKRIIKVENVLNTLQALAKYHREQFTIPFIAITGSNGKTTTKELINEVLSTTHTTYTTVGNLNNHIGIPLTILSVRKNADLAVIEMGANHQKEIEAYCTYTLPTHGVITNCGKAHLEGFGGEDGVSKGKGELYDFLRKHNGTAFVMWDYDYLQSMSKGIPTIITYGTSNADVIGQIKASNELLEVDIVKGADITTIKTKLVGNYNLSNVLAAVTIGKYFNVSDNKIKEALENYTPSNSRSQLLKKDSNTIILDAYNANPTSMKAAIENFAAMQGSNKILLLGGMMELGEDSIKEHQAIIDVISKYLWKNVVLVGGNYTNTNHSYIYFKNAMDAKEWYKQQGFKNTNILIKGSRSLQMEKVLE